LTRPAKRKEKQPQLIAANVDQLVIVSALKRPQYKTGLIDRYLIVAHRAEIEAALCLNKIDLGQPTELERARAELRPYQDLGFPVVWTSAKTGEGIDELSARLADKRSVLVGHSGVGKSKLAGRMQSGIKLASSAVRRSGKGRHTTSTSTLIPLDFGGELVDTPGVRELGVTDIPREKLARHFIEFEPLLGSCKFKSCSHIPEPGCAIKEAVESGRIHRARHESYVNLYHELTSAGKR
jgi:ribosome biogenesis GTPase